MRSDLERDVRALAICGIAMLSDAAQDVRRNDVADDGG